MTEKTLGQIASQACEQASTSQYFTEKDLIEVHESRKWQPIETAPPGERIMKERRILFNADEVRSILSGQKTQVRRAMKVQPTSNNQRPLMHVLSQKIWWFNDKNVAASKPFKCPHGQIGDRLWVGESFATDEADCIVYQADAGLNSIVSDNQGNFGSFEFKPADMHALNVSNGHAKWRRSVHMPRATSRITLEITDIRVERLNEISQSDAYHEGVSLKMRQEQFGCSNERFIDEYDFSLRGAKGCYRMLWESINGAGSWDKNPWVWVIEFKRIEVKNE